jgi:hypothetical protein
MAKKRMPDDEVFATGNEDLPTDAKDAVIEILEKGRLDPKRSGLLAHLLFHDRLADSNCDCIVRCGCVSKCGGCQDLPGPVDQE